MEQTEKYEYFSLRDREAYTELKHFWDGNCHQQEQRLPTKRRISIADNEADHAGVKAHAETHNGEIPEDAVDNK